MTAAQAAPPALIPVPCSGAALGAAITVAPGHSTLVLAPACTYRLTAPLPDIARALTVIGSFATIKMTGTGTIVAVDGAFVTFRDLIFTGGSGTGTAPGAILNDGGTLALAGTTFAGNSGGLGSAVQNTGGGRLTIVASSFAGNTAAFGGAVANLGDGTVSLAATSFTGNTETSPVLGDGGAALYASGNGTITSSFGATFRDNTAAGSGGALYSEGGQVTMVGASFSGNQELSGAGGGGAVRLTNGGGGSFTRTSFTGNSAGIGGAISTTDDFTLAGDTLSGNHASQRGGGIFVDFYATATLTGHTMITRNSAGISGGGIYLNIGTVILTGGSTVTGNTPNNCTNLTC
jgi:predicted outer membrane repeat protein